MTNIQTLVPRSVERLTVLLVYLIGMGRPLTVTLSEDRYERIENMVESGDVSSKSEAVNQLIDRGERANELEARNNELQQKLRVANAQSDRVNDLAEYVEGERELQQRERERRDAPLWKRLEWFVFGR